MVIAISVGIYLLVINILGFILFGADKKRAKKRKRRIPEWLLLWMARLGGGLGCWLGMVHFNHKKDHGKFQKLIPVWIFIWLIIIIVLLALSHGNVLDEIQFFQSTYRNR